MTCARHEHRSSTPARRSGVIGIAIALTASLWCISPSAARADTIGVPLRLGVTGGFHVTSGDIDLMSPRLASHRPSSGPMAGLRVGVRAARILEFELNAGAVFASSDVGGVTLLPITGDVVLRPFPGDVIPTVSVGGGVMLSLPETGNADADVVIRTTLGVEFGLTPLVALRIEAGLLLGDAVDGALALSPVITAGIDFLFWRESTTLTRPEQPEQPEAAPVAAPERSAGDDGDGLTFPSDRCPNHAGAEASFGCPDSDGDGVIDVVDQCPTRAGTPRTEGCPDADRDGVDDRYDACIGETGRVERHGCPR